MKKLLFIINLIKTQSITDLIFEKFVVFNNKVYKKFNEILYSKIKPEMEKINFG